MANACGVDFGTSNSTVGWLRPDAGQSLLLPLEDGRATLPSVVFFNADENEFSYGRSGLNEYLSGYEGRLMRSLKSLLGSGAIDGQTEVGGRALPYRGLLAQFIGELKKRAERAAGTSFSRVVMGRPVHFVDDDLAADQLAQDTLEEIARSVGFTDIEFQFEPIAAAFDYESRIDGEELVLIADIGGGTSDFSLVRLSPQRAARQERRDDILANGGVHIGGTDFDKYFSLSCVMPLLGLGGRLAGNAEVPSSYYFNLATWHTINQLYTRKTWQQLQDVAREAVDRERFARLLDVVEQRCGHWLALQVEGGKIALSSQESATLDLQRLRPAQTLELNRADFDTAVEHLVQSVEQTVSGLLRQAGLRASDIDSVFFTGGSSGVNLLRQRIGALVPDAKHVEGDLFGSIGSGLAIDAARKFG
ncbi:MULTISPECIES: Hsp70 family protein [unclassified Herbaspirillum]|uniref:Hsp70 family protein n=1 Tax=unclassified Herbaspirillum TaxID=2624150 RepID=UPI001153F305|nr:MULTISPECIES: Hsp70 family protein [unclassified Herbaspirillum]MBB5392726.1 putative chaperone protein [Herbaspirillum sp. SJZ102]TQJ99102.1 putative chaperone protein [Herbaspirillum sp. SJZ130]TQK04115.1 putative chaperone protein [Herbaspirillum sp. SJZ106]